MLGGNFKTLSKGQKKWEREEGNVLKIISQGKISFLPEKKKKNQFKTLQAGLVEVGFPRGLERQGTIMDQEETQSVLKGADPCVGITDEMFMSPSPNSYNEA